VCVCAHIRVSDLRRDGFHQASIDEIAEEAGFSRGAVYSSFANKEEFFPVLHDRAANRLQTRSVRLVWPVRGGLRSSIRE
jgi:AcrR family transcriptional regulator